MLKTLLVIVLFTSVLASQGSLQVTPLTTTLFKPSNYHLSYYTVFPLPSNSQFIVDFSNTYIEIPDAQLNVTAKIQNNAVTGATVNCVSKICTLKPMNAMMAYQTLGIEMGLLTNPYFLYKQTISTKVVFNSSYTQHLFWDILPGTYSPLGMTLNSMTQSNYGVGNTDVTYTFNLSLSMTPSNPQLSLTIPSQVGYGSLTTSLSFFNNIQNFSPMIFSNIIMFNIMASASNSSGIIFMTVGGLVNPKSIGNSSSFSITIQLSSLPSGGSCTGCTVATVNSNILARSTVPGNIETISFQNSDKQVNAENTISIYSKLLASIPAGGKYQITLPASVQPKLPISCINGYGFSINSPPASCSYQASTHTITTNNFFFSGTGNVVLKTTIINPPDSRTVFFTFQTFDELGNMIGNSSQPTSLTASPLPLQATISKNVSQVDTLFKLSVNISLGVSLTQSDTIKVILPSALYTLSGINCFSASLSITCTHTIDQVTNNLIVSMAPPCSNCNVGSTLSFAIDSLTNPSFISVQSQQITVETAHPQGIVEQVTLSSPLSASTVSVSNYQRLGVKAVGSPYSMSFRFNIPNYISSNGGLLIIKFTQDDSYVAVTQAGGSFTYPSSIVITDSSQANYPNTITYYSSNSNTPHSVHQITIQICGSNPCSGQVILSGLIRGYYPLSTMTQTIELSTTGSNSIATNSFSVLQENPVSGSHTLEMVVSNSVTTLTSSYVFTFVSEKIPIQGKFTLSFSSMHSINGNCFGVQNSTLFSGVITCSVTDPKTIELTVSGNLTPMMIQIIKYTITVTNVSNPATIQPLTYSINTLYNQVVSQTFSTTYRIQNPLPLSLTYMRSNNTYGQAATLTLTVSSSAPTFDEVKLLIPSNLMTVSSSSNYLAALNNNIFEVSQIYSLTNNSVSIEIVNPTSTTITGNINLTMFLAGYLTAQGTISISTVSPVFLGITASTSSRVVGSTTALSLQFNRVHPFSAETSFVISISSTLFNLGSATYNGNPLSLPLTVPISTSSLVIQNLTNILFVPSTPSASGLTIYTVDSSDSKVAMSSYNASELAPNTANVGISFTFTRSNTAISGLGSLTISYTPRFPSVAASIKIGLPQNQMKMLSTSCQIQTNSLQDCQVLSSNSQTILVTFQNQTKTILTNVTNLQPNSNQLTIQIYNTQGQLVEKSIGTVTPPIQLNQLTVTGSTTNTQVASNTNLTLAIKSHSSVASTSIIIIEFPAFFYSSITALTSSSCSYLISGLTYSSCSMKTDSNGWVTQVNLTDLGSLTILANETISLKMVLANGWTSKLFGSSQFVFYIESVDKSFLSHGVFSLAAINGGHHFSQASISSLNMVQSSSQAGQQSNITVTFQLLVATAQGTIISLKVPKSSYNLNISAIQASSTLSSSQQTTDYYQLYFTSTCTQIAPLCMLSPSNYSFTVKVNNNLFVSLTQLPLSVQVLKASDFVSSPASISVPSRTPQSVGSPLISRSVKNANQLTNVTLSFTHNGVSTFDLTISPLSTPSGNVSLLTSLNSVLLGQSSVTHSLSNGAIQVNIAGQNTITTTIVLEGTNSFLIPAVKQEYLVTIKNSQFVFFQSRVIPSDSLIPYSQGLHLQRIVTTVGLPTQVYLHGVFPYSIPSMSVAFNGNNFTLIGITFNISLGNVTNPLDVTNVSKVLILIKNTDLIAFSSQVSYSPQLTPQTLGAFTSLAVDSNLNVSQVTNLTLSLQSYQFSRLSITFPVFFSNLNQCCIDSSCTQASINSCTLTSTSKNTIDLVLGSSQTVDRVVFTVKAINYEATFTESSVAIVSGLPSAQFDTNISTVVHTLPIISSLTLNTQMVNAANTFTLFIQPIQENGFISISLPTFITSQLTSSSSTYSLLVDSSLSSASLSNTSPNFMVAVNTGTKNISLTLDSITNPSDSRPLTFKVEQSSDNSFNKVYGRKTLTSQMTQFDLITVTAVNRSATKMGIPVNLTISITTPNYAGSMVINFPPSQLFTQNNCSISVNGQSKSCSVVNISAIVTENIPGTAVYQVQGLKNQLSFSSASQYDLVEVKIGLPYTKAATKPSTSTFVSPMLTLGAITLNSVSSSSLISLSLTNLVYNFTIENSQNIDGFIINYSPYYYYLTSQINCLINSQQTNCSEPSPNSIYIAAPSSFPSYTVILDVNKLINYVQASNWTIKSVKRVNTTPVTYSDVDVYFSNSHQVGAITANSLSVRVMFPNNYVQSNAVSINILIDNTFSQIPLSQLRVNISIPEGSCQKLEQQFSSSFLLSCTFTSPLDASLSINLYHLSYPSVTLASSTSTIPILASPTSNCNNQMCDLCSTYQGQQYCFSCRQGMFSSNGHCVQLCPSTTFPYLQSGVCQKCYPDCSSCFGYTKNQCLSCSNPTLILNSGFCDVQCPQGSFSYLGFCVQNKQCTSQDGCRICSSSGFCYQCLPDYVGEPTCTYNSPLPPTLMIYILIPFVLMAIVTVIVAAAKCGGADSTLSQFVFSFSLVELVAWVLTVPIMPNIFTSMLLLSFLALRVMISIVSYEVYYRQNLGQLSQKLLQIEEESNKQSQKSQKKEQDSKIDNWKTKMVRFIAHFNGPDSYELLRSRIAQPILSVNHHIAVHILFMATRWVVGILMIYMLTVATFGDSLLMPVAVITSSAVISLSRLLMWDKIRNCFNRCRSSS